MTAVTNRRFLSLHQPGCTNKAFTLIELLVVIAIISLLVSILLPSLNRAKDLAKTAVCLSTMRNGNLTAQLESNDRSGMFTALASKLGSDWTWTFSWAEMASRWGYWEESSETFDGTPEQGSHCPLSQQTSEPEKTLQKYTYGANYDSWAHQGGANDGSYGFREFHEAIDDADEGLRLHNVVTDQISRTDTFVMLADNCRVMTDGTLTNYARIDPANYIGGPVGGGLWAVHNDHSVNAAYADGHVEATDAETIIDQLQPKRFFVVPPFGTE